MRRGRIDLSVSDAEPPCYLQVDNEILPRTPPDLALLADDADTQQLDAAPHLFVNVLFSQQPGDIEEMERQAEVVEDHGRPAHVQPILASTHPGLFAFRNRI